MDLNLKQEALQHEKSAARKTGNIIGAGIIVISIVVYIVSYAFAFLVRILPNEMHSLASHPLFMHLLNAGINIIGFFIGGLIIIKAQGKKINSVVEYKKPTKNIFPLIFIGLGLCMAGNMIASIFASYISEFFGFTPAGPDLTLPTDLVGIITYFVTTSLVPAVFEEFLYRGAVYGSLKKFGKPLAIIISSILFALMHGNLIQIPFAFVVGLGLGFITAESDSIWPAMIVHFLNNFFACVLDYVGLYFGDNIESAAFAAYMMILLGLGALFAMLYIFKNKGSAFNYKKTGHLSSKGKLFSTISFSPVIIVFYVLTVISIIEAQLG